jgi:hypothetical protein
MKNKTAGTRPSMKIIRNFKLPTFEREPGPLHSLIQDQFQNIYYSDEINHSLVSLDKSGNIRWHHSKKGSDPGELCYPKGIDLGLIRQNGNIIRCLAVCDAWNQRIQFFDTEGKYLCQWEQLGESTFGDVIDIRFIHHEVDGGKVDSCWLVLDQGHKALFGLDLSGRQLFRIGRSLPGFLEADWKIPSEFGIEMPAIERFRACIPYDPLFNPSRIIGSTWKGLFILESGSLHLKHTGLGNIMQVCIELPKDATWTSADETGLLCFNGSRGLLGIYDSNKKNWLFTTIVGTPIASGRSSKKLWVQDGGWIRHLSCSHGQGEYVNSNFYVPWFVNDISHEVECMLKKGMASVDFHPIIEAATILREQSNKVLRTTTDQWADTAFVEEQKEFLALWNQTFTTVLLRLKKLNFSIFFGFLKIKILRAIYPSQEYERYFNEAWKRIKTAQDFFEREFGKMLCFRDEWFITRLATVKIEEITKSQNELLQEYYDTLMRPVREFAGLQWSIHVPESMNDGPEGQTQIPLNGISNRVGIFIRSPQNNFKYFREIDRIYVGNSERAEYVSPASICYCPSTGYWVSLNNGGQILNLNRQGRAIKCFDLINFIKKTIRRPLGIAMDVNKRIWISLPSEDCIEIIDVNTNQRTGLDALAKKSLGLKNPTGIYRTSNGKMLIADTQNNRILISTERGHVSVLVDSIGEPETLLHPIAFCGAKKTSEFWVVEIRNHRLQRFSLEGESMEVNGSPGLGEGQFVMPESTAIFEDGMITISQRQCKREIKLFSEDGSELETLQLDYSPWGILAHDNLLLACEGNGNHIHVYERK